jgi:taurine dioxygenase
VEIRGVDLGGDLSEGALDALRDAWLDNGVAVFPGQSLDDDALVAFTRRLGPLFVHVRTRFHSRDRPEVMMISKVDEPDREYSTLGDGELSWHTDQAYTGQPAFGTLLYALEIPNSGGDTEYCDLAAAYQEMPHELAHRVGRRQIAYFIDASARTHGICATPAQRQAAPDVSHPIVRQHPLRGGYSRPLRQPRPRAGRGALGAG